MNRRLRELERLLAERGPALHALLLRLTLRPDAAEDLMQDLFLNLARSDGFVKADNPAGYAYQSAIHLAMGWRKQNRKQGFARVLAHDPAAQAPTPLGRLIDTEQIDRILDALDDLSEEPRRIVVLRFIQDQSYESIGQQVGKDTHTTRALCHKAIYRLRTMLNEKEEPNASHR